MGLVFTSVGAVITTLIGILVGSILSSRSQQRQWLRDRKAEACAQVLRESSRVMIELAALRWKHVTPRLDGVVAQSPMDWKPWNEALALISLVGDYDIVDAAYNIDAELWPLHVQIRQGWTNDKYWRALSEPVEAARRNFVNVARLHLAPPGPPLQRISGRPPISDPIWQLRAPFESNPAPDAE